MQGFSAYFSASELADCAVFSDLDWAAASLLSSLSMVVLDDLFVFTSSPRSRMSSCITLIFAFRNRIVASSLICPASTASIASSPSASMSPARTCV